MSLLWKNKTNITVSSRAQQYFLNSVFRLWTKISCSRTLETTPYRYLAQFRFQGFPRYGEGICDPMVSEVIGVSRLIRLPVFKTTKVYWVTNFMSEFQPSKMYYNLQPVKVIKNIQSPLQIRNSERF